MKKQKKINKNSRSSLGTNEVNTTKIKKNSYNNITNILLYFNVDNKLIK